MSRNLLNYLALQGLWLLAVCGAGRGVWWWALAGLAAFVLLHAALGLSRRQDAVLVLGAVLLGAVVDSVMAASGLVRYAAPVPSPALAPIWILALWAGLALTLRHSLAWLMRRPLPAMLVLGIGGPLSYLGAQTGFGAVRFAAPALTGLLVLGVLWAVASGLLSALMLRLAPAPALASAQQERHP